MDKQRQGGQMEGQINRTMVGHRIIYEQIDQCVKRWMNG